MLPHMSFEKRFVCCASVATFTIVKICFCWSFSGLIDSTSFYCFTISVVVVVATAALVAVDDVCFLLLLRVFFICSRFH